MTLEHAHEILSWYQDCGPTEEIKEALKVADRSLKAWSEVRAIISKQYEGDRAAVDKISDQCHDADRIRVMFNAQADGEQLCLKIIDDHLYESTNIESCRGGYEMAKYINSEDMVKDADDIIRTSADMFQVTVAKKVLWYASHLKAADVKPVVHGHWRLMYVNYDKNGNNQYTCSECKSEDFHSPQADVNYCWHCGALMDEEVEVCT